jgi:hypothetical protein
MHEHRLRRQRWSGTTEGGHAAVPTPCAASRIRPSTLKTSLREGSKWQEGRAPCRPGSCWGRPVRWEGAEAERWQRVPPGFQDTPVKPHPRWESPKGVSNNPFERLGTLVQDGLPAAEANWPPPRTTTAVAHAFPHRAARKRGEYTGGLSGFSRFAARPSDTWARMCRGVASKADHEGQKGPLRRERTATSDAQESWLIMKCCLVELHCFLGLGDDQDSNRLLR